MSISTEELKQIQDTIAAALNEERACLTIAECARYSRIGEDKIRELVAKAGTDFPYFKVGVKTLINKALLDKWLERAAIERKQL